MSIFAQLSLVVNDCTANTQDIDETNISTGELDVFHDNVKVHEYKSGESFGESSLLFKRPRS